MSKSNSRSIKKKVSTSTVVYPLPEIKPEYLPISNKNKSSLSNDIFHDEKISQFILEDDMFKYFSSCEISGDKSSGSQSSWTDDLEIKSTKVVENEYDLVERLLYGEEKFDFYNKEFDEWMDNFKYLRIVGSGIKLSHSRSKNMHNDLETESEEILAEHRDTQNTHFRQSYLQEIRNKVKETVINNILQNAKLQAKSSSNLTARNNSRQKWKHQNRNGTQPKFINPSKQIKSVLPIRKHSSGANTLYGINNVEQHPIIRSNISSSKWQKSNKESFNFPLLSEENKSLNRVKDKKYNSPRKISCKEKNLTLPLIKDCAFQPDGNNKGFFLRSNSCNTHKSETSIPRSKISYRTSSSRIPDN